VGYENGPRPQRLQQLECQKDVNLARGDERGVHEAVAAVAHVALDAASALAHAVDFALLDVEAGDQGRFGQHLRCGDDALSSDAGQQYVCCH